MSFFALRVGARSKGKQIVKIGTCKVSFFSFFFQSSNSNKRPTYKTLPSHLETEVAPIAKAASHLTLNDAVGSVQINLSR